jgi:hypothetical protein
VSYRLSSSSDLQGISAGLTVVVASELSRILRPFPARYGRWPGSSAVSVDSLGVATQDRPDRPAAVRARADAEGPASVSADGLQAARPRIVVNLSRLRAHVPELDAYLAKIAAEI